MPADVTLDRTPRRRGIAERLVLGAAARLACGELTLQLHDGSRHSFRGAEPGPSASLAFKRPRAARRLIAGGDLGLAEAYMDGDWDTPDLRGLLELGIRNEARLLGLLEGRLWARILGRAIHSLRPNSRRGARRNIAAHYDLGNEFYTAWLDPSLTYSAGLFGHAGEDLAAAQERKFRRMAALARIAPQHHVLEIGCGWGGFCLWAAREIGCRVTAVTISRAQHDQTLERVRAQGLEDKIEVRLQDYRDLDGRFDAIVSIEMMEAVGEAYWPVYARQLRDRLKPGGHAALQVITIDDGHFEGYRRRADFIQRYVFPGGMLPSPSILRELAKAAGLEWKEAAGHAADYARTLALWHRRFDEAWPGIAALGGGGCYDERFRRLWKYYLAYCEAGFLAARIDVLQVALSRPPGPAA